MAIKLFERDTSVSESAEQLGLAYNTVFRLYRILRHAIVITDSNYQSFSGEIEMIESYFSGRRKGDRDRAAGKVPVFGILERGGNVTVEVVSDGKGGHCAGIGYQESETRESDLHRPIQKLQWSCLIWIQTPTY